MADKNLVSLLAREDFEGLRALARQQTSMVLRYLSGRLYSADETEKWGAVRGLGAIMADLDIIDESRGADMLRRFFWAMNDESGAVPYGVPEAIGEILVRRPEFQKEFLPILCSMLTHEDLIQTGPIERGVMWALGRIGPPVAHISPDVIKALKHAAWSHPEEQTRATAARALAQVNPATGGAHDPDLTA